MTLQLFPPYNSSLIDKFTCMPIHCPVYEEFFLQKIGIYSYGPDRTRTVWNNQMVQNLFPKDLFFSTYIE